MASPSLPPSSTASPLCGPSIETAIQAVDSLVEYGLSQDDIVALSKLGSARVHTIVDLLERVGQTGVERLLSSLEGMPETALVRFSGRPDAVSRKFFGRVGRRTFASAQNSLQEHSRHCLHLFVIPVVALRYNRVQGAGCLS